MSHLHGQEQSIGSTHGHSDLMQKLAFRAVLMAKRKAAVFCCLLHRIQRPTQMATVALGQGLQRKKKLELHTPSITWHNSSKYCKRF